MASRKQDLRVKYQMAFLGGDDERCERIEGLIRKEISTADQLIGWLGKWQLTTKRAQAEKLEKSEGII